MNIPFYYTDGLPLFHRSRSQSHIESIKYMVILLSRCLPPISHLMNSFLLSHCVSSIVFVVIRSVWESPNTSHSPRSRCTSDLSIVRDTIGTQSPLYYCCAKVNFCPKKHLTYVTAVEKRRRTLENVGK